MVLFSLPGSPFYLVSKMDLAFRGVVRGDRVASVGGAASCKLSLIDSGAIMEA
tara:strand:- start:1905 stop:2063 length:159 start_codon:yes stop_codon:yes gene_type:complete